MDWISNGIILGVLFLASSFFSGTETALFSLSKFDKRRLETRHRRLSKWILQHLDHPRRTLMSILIGNLVANTLSTVMVTLLILDYFGPQHLGLGILIFTVFLIFFCEIFPKVLAVRYNEAFALMASIPLKIFATVIFPVRWAAQFASDRVLRLMIPERHEKTEMISEEDLKTLVKIGEEEGVLDKQERDMIHKLFELGNRPVREIMTPRTDVKALEIAASPEEHREILRVFHFSHLPVYQDSLDHILGVISVQEYLLSDQRTVRSCLQEPLFIPESKRIDEALEALRKKEHGFAVCLDEFGGTAGIVTLEDILEEIFGEYYDEYAKVEKPIHEISHGHYLVQAKIGLTDFNEFFKVDLTAEEATTLGGYILEKTGEAPRHGQTVIESDLEIRVHHVQRQRILTG